MTDTDHTTTTPHTIPARQRWVDTDIPFSRFTVGWPSRITESLERSMEENVGVWGALASQ
jgi:hypothetical protein